MNAFFSGLLLTVGYKQDEKSNRYDSILQWLQTENASMITQ